MPWRIVGERCPETGEPLFWNSADGWADAASADVFSDAERERLALPLGGEWERVTLRPFWVSVRGVGDDGSVTLPLGGPWRGEALDAAHAERLALAARWDSRLDAASVTPVCDVAALGAMPDGWAPEAPDVIALEALDAWAERERENADACERTADAYNAGAWADSAEALRGEAAGSRALADYADALAPILADVLAADALREAAEALDAAAASLDAAAGLLSEAEGETAAPTFYPARGREAAADAQRARDVARALRQRVERAETAERMAAARAWAAGPEVAE